MRTRAAFEQIILLIEFYLRANILKAFYSEVYAQIVGLRSPL